ncbi:4-aminobutyrate--2-oxoglutarate transaminase [Paludibacterium yongneupense]|uniref:4-aminobutyrate--2-oxoglutarate transaminase n=1 Tax=Paludibacterium yongneupense TaxID=400061 RepID=UPI0004161EF4|nr:4-aminobutyrate--2-oxoglutarate transaminase [Paludibacterium yongneupense]
MDRQTLIDNTSLAQRRRAATSLGVGVATDIYPVRAKNAEVWDGEGRRYIDFAAGIAVLNTGHLHPRVQAAAKAQLDQFSHTCYQVLPYAGYVELAERLNALAPIEGPAKSLFVTTGAEAVENAVKIARAATGRPGIISFNGGFHGRTNLTMALTGKVAPYKIGFGPLAGGVYHAAYPNALHGISCADALASVEALFKYDIAAQEVAAILIEPVQGEGGFVPAPAEFMHALRALCDRHGILLIADEVQSGFARTGKLFAMEYFDVKPDLMCIAKSLAGGLPLSGVVGRAALMDAPVVGGLGGTYGGNPVAIAAALAVLDVIEDEDLCRRADAIGARIKARLGALAARVPQIADVRGPGAMVAVEFMQDGEPAQAFLGRVKARALELGLILLSCGVYGNVIRFLCPLTIEDTVLEEALDILERSLLDAGE